MPDFSTQGLPLRATLQIYRGDYLNVVVTVKQADGSDVSWAGFTGTLVVPASFPGTVALNPAAVDTPGAGEVTIDINTSAVAEDVRGHWAVEVLQGSERTTLWEGRLECDHGSPTRLRIDSACGAKLVSDGKEPIVVYVPAQGIQGPQGDPGVGAADFRSGKTNAGSFSGDPLTASVVFSSPLPDADYSATASAEMVNGRQIPVAVDNPTASGLDLVLGSQDIAGLVGVHWQAIPNL